MTKSEILVAVLLTASVHRALLAADEPDKDPQMPKLLQEARELTNAKKRAAAVAKCDQVIGRFTSAYAAHKERIYCARSSAESLGYLMKSAVDADSGSATKPGATVLSSTWADAYFMKAYALQDLDRMTEAKTAIKAALELSPASPRYLNEMGEIYELEKNWPKALQTFKKAEDNNPLSPDNERAPDLGQARRGIGYVLVELGKLGEAEQKYQQCLRSDPNDTRAARELDYVKQLRSKQNKR